MKFIRRVVVVPALMAFITLVGLKEAIALEPQQVIIDPSLGYVTLYMSLPEPKSREVKDMLLAHEGAYVISWRDFKANPDRYIAAYIRRNDEPHTDLAGGLRLLLSDFRGQRFGLTWFGAIAFSDEDYRFAQESFRQYRKNPDVVVVEPQRRRKPGRLPITPGACDRNGPPQKLFK